jgi:hypothetical protein
MDFPFPSAVLKKRIHPKAKTGEPLIKFTNIRQPMLKLKTHLFWLP